MSTETLGQTKVSSSSSFHTLKLVHPDFISPEDDGSHSSTLGVNWSAGVDFANTILDKAPYLPALSPSQFASSTAFSCIPMQRKDETLNTLPKATASIRDNFDIYLPGLPNVWEHDVAHFQSSVTSVANQQSGKELQQHAELHTDGPQDQDKPYKCPHCKTAYAHQCSLARHRRQCEGIFVLSCLFCGKLFHRKDRYRVHLLSKHKYVDKKLGPPGYTLTQQKRNL